MLSVDNLEAYYGTSAYATVQSELRGYALGPKK